MRASSSLVYAIIVTYADRFHLLEQVIKACCSEGIDKIIVVDNNSNESSQRELKSLENSLDNCLKVIYLNKNSGSSGGYKRGMEEAYKDNNCSYIWLLDDDNKPQKGSLKTLKEYWESLSKEEQNEKFSLLSYRQDRKAYKEAIMTGNPDLVLGEQNSFLGFHIFNLLNKIVKRKPNIQTRQENIHNGLVSVAPYGGMFFHKNLIATIGYPKEDFFVYADDHDWSYRIIKNGGEIHLLLDSVIEDIDTSWHVSETNESIFKIIAKGNPFRVYYTTRNRVFFEKEHLVNKPFLYLVNRVVFHIILLFFSVKNLSNYQHFCNAVRDGLNDNMGENTNIYL